MTTRVFNELIEARWDEGKFVCVGLDSDLTSPKFPQTARIGNNAEKTLLNFNLPIVDATHDLVCAYKPNIAFYEGLGVPGLTALYRTIRYIHQVAPRVPVIGDVKRGDIGNTNLGYVKMAFEILGVDAVTVHPYLGAEDGMQPFLDQKDKGIFVLARTSNKGAKEFQDLITLSFDPRKRPEGMSAEEWLEKICQERKPLYQQVALDVATKWNKNGNCGVVAGATFPEELGKIRAIIGDDVPILIPAIGVQGGDVEKAVKYGMNKEKKGAIYNCARAIIFASDGPDFAEAAQRETLKLHEMINQYR